jgi:crossover junction endodeoxyribonuclease RuvC
MPQALSELPPHAGLVLGVDPGLLCTGYALLSAAAGPREARLIEAGVVRLARGAPLPARLVELEGSLTALIERHRPDTLACEELYAHYKHPRTAILMAHARGVILALAARLGLHVVSVAATNAKKLLTGSGRAKKRQMQLAVMTTLRLPVLPEPHDVADAIAIALCGLRLQQAARAAKPRANQSPSGSEGLPRGPAAGGRGSRRAVGSSAAGRPARLRRAHA